MSATVEDAYVLAVAMHAGQVDKAGKPYIEHPVRVAYSILLASVNEGGALVPHNASEFVRRQVLSAVSPRRRDLTVQVAYLHDVVEDTSVTLRALDKAGFAPEVVAAVELLTRTKQKSSKEYYDDISQSDIALAVKLADIDDNVDERRLAKLDAATQERLRKKYATALDALAQAQDRSGDASAAQE